MELDEELEKDLTFRRFSPEKQDQIRQLVSYTTLLGLTGKDLISIGGRLERIGKSREIKANKKIAAQYYPQLEEIYNTSHNYRRRFKYTTSSGVYEIATDGWVTTKVTNCKTNKSRSIPVKHFEVGHSYSGVLYNIALNIHHGHIKFDF